MLNNTKGILSILVTLPQSQTQIRNKQTCSIVLNLKTTFSVNYKFGQRTCIQILDGGENAIIIDTSSMVCSVHIASNCHERAMQIIQVEDTDRCMITNHFQTSIEKDRATFINLLFW